MYEAVFPAFECGSAVKYYVSVATTDGSTFFVNMQADGWTRAITGPWETRRS